MLSNHKVDTIPVICSCYVYFIDDILYETFIRAYHDCDCPLFDQWRTCAGSFKTKTLRLVRVLPFSFNLFWTFSRNAKTLVFFEVRETM